MVNRFPVYIIYFLPISVNACRHTIIQQLAINTGICLQSIHTAVLAPDGLNIE